MSTKIELTVACGDYEIMRALKEGVVKPDGIDLKVVTQMDSPTRHWRFLRNQEFDMAEVSCSSYVAAQDHDYPFTAIPVFPHRRFRHGFAFINTAKGIREPKDLVGRKVGVKFYANSAALWLRGIMESQYGVPNRSVEYFAEIDEDIDFTPPDDLKLTRLPHNKYIVDMLLDGELDALYHPDLIKPLVNRDPRVARLFPDYKKEEEAYFRQTRIFPIMHVMGIRKEIVAKYPWVPINMFHAFEESKAIGMKRMENPRMVPLAWYREAWEEQEAIIGKDPWEYGLTERNRNTLETLVGFSYAHGIIKRRIPIEELFISTFKGRKRGGEFQFKIAAQPVLRLCAAAAVSEDTPLRVQIGGFAYAVFCAGGEYFVTADACTHGAASLAEGSVVDHEIECPFHQGRFDLRTGAATAPPCLMPIRTWTARVADGQILIDPAEPAKRP